MTQKLLFKTLFFGFLSWVIPFGVSVLFYNEHGELTVPYATFKSIMIVTGTVSGSYLLYRYFRLVDDDFVRNGVLVGLFWFVINIILDTAVLIPLMKTSFAEYFVSIGLGYLALPAISIAIGYVLKAKVE